MSDQLGREGLALAILNAIKVAENKPPEAADRIYTLTLLEQILTVIDKPRTTSWPIQKGPTPTVPR